MQRFKRWLLGACVRLSGIYLAVKSCFTYNRVAIFVVLVTVVFSTLNYFEAFNRPPAPALPKEFSNLQVMAADRLETILHEQPQTISKAIVFNGLRNVVVYGGGPNLAGYLVYNVEPADLVVRFDAAKIKHETKAAAMVSVTPEWAVLVTIVLWGLAVLVLLGVLIRYQDQKNREQYSGDSYDDSNPTSRRMSLGAPQTKDMMGKPSGKPLTWDDVAGNPEGIDRLRRIERFIKYGAWFRTCMARTPKGILMVGPPGTGKTLLVKILAWVCDCNFLQVSGSDFDEQLVGVGAGRWRKVVAQAVALWKKNGKLTILFIDEVECIAKARGQREHTETTTAMLTSIDGFSTCPGLIFLAATNHPEILDPAFTRPGRFGERVNVDPPDMVAREAIFAIKVRGMQLAPDVNLKDLAAKTMGFTGAEIELICNEAATTMAERLLPQIIELKVGEADFEKQPRLVAHADFVKGIDYVRMGDELLSRMASQTDEERRSIEIHEAGHAYVNHKTGGPPPASLSRIIRQKSLGVFIKQQERESYSSSDVQMLGHIKTCLAGRLAQEILLGIKDTAPSEDFRMASKCARQMVGMFGMTAFGFGTIPLDDNGLPQRGQLSGWLHTRFDKAWTTLLAECEAEVRKLITDGKQIVENLAAAMELSEKLTGEQVTLICNGGDPELVVAGTALTTLVN